MNQRCPIFIAFMLILAIILPVTAMADITFSQSTISANMEWGPGSIYFDDPVIIVVVDVKVGYMSTPTLTIRPGTTVKFAAGKSLTIGDGNFSGRLVADGTAVDPIIFTTSNTTPAAGQWKGVILSASASTGSVIDHCVFEYGGYGTNAVLKISNKSDIPGLPVVTNTTFRHNGHDAVFAQGAQTNVVRPLISDNIFDDNYHAVICQVAEPVLEYNNLTNNRSGVAVLNYSVETYCVVAENNWWGDATGPFDDLATPDLCGGLENLDGQGDGASTGVDYLPWLATDITALRPPTPLAPPDGAFIFNTMTPLLEVNNSANSPGSAIYDFEVYILSHRLDTVIAAGQSPEGDGTTSWQVPANILAENITYYWRSRIQTGEETSDWFTPSFSFVIDLDDPPTAFDLATPQNQETVTTLTPQMNWTSADDSDNGDEVRYNLYYAVTPFEQTPQPGSHTDITGPPFTFPNPLSDNTIYYWDVEAYDTRGNTVWSSGAGEFAVNVSNDAPTAPTLNSPINGSDTNSLNPTLIINNSTDVDPYHGDLTYHFQVSRDGTFNTTEISQTGISEGSGPTTSWTTPTLQHANDTYYWRARAYDGLTYSAWSSSRTFISGDLPADLPPGAFNLLSPNHDARVFTTTPTLSWEAAVDPEGQEVTYQVYYDDNAQFTSPEITPPQSATSYTFSSNELIENSIVYWKVEAGDPEENTTFSSEAFRFGVDALTDTPTVPVLQSPADGAVWTDLTPAFTFQNSTDPSPFAALVYTFQVDDNPIFSSPFTATIADNGLSISTYTLTQNLADNTEHFWRVSALNETSGESSGFSSIFSLVVNQANEAPTAPILLSPANGVLSGDTTPTLQVTNATDIDPNDVLTYSFIVAENANMTGVVAQTSGVAGGLTTTSWTVTTNLAIDQTYYWTAYATDAQGQSGPQATPFSFTIPPNLPPNAPTILSPANESVVYDQTPLLRINTADDPDNDPLTYFFDLATDADFENIIDFADHVSPGGSTVNFQVSQTMNWGQTYYWRAQAYDGQLFGNFVNAEFMMNNPPDAPTLLSPANSAVEVGLSPTLTVQNALDPENNALVYGFEVATDPAFSPGTIVALATSVTAGANQTAWVVSPTLAYSTTYFWRSRASDGFATGIFSATWSFTTQAEPPVVINLLSPADGAHWTTSLRPTLTWEAITLTRALTSFDVLIDDDPAFATPQVVSGLETTSYTFTFNLIENETYTWKVLGNDDSGVQIPSAQTWTLAIDTQISSPGAFTLVSPADAAVLITPPTLQWTASTDPDPDDAVDYKLYLAANPDFNSPLVFSNLSETNYTPETLNDNSAYYWAVEAYDVDRHMTASTPPYRRFYLDANNEPPLTVQDGFSPSAGSTTGREPIISWNDAADPDPLDTPGTLHYLVQISMDGDDFSDARQYTTEPGLTQVTVDEPLDFGTWFYRIKTFDDGGLSSVFTDPVMFIVPQDPPTAPTLLQPANMSVITTINPSLIVFNATDPNQLPLTYEFQLSLSDNFSTLVASIIGLPGEASTTAWVVSPALQENRIYYWRVRASNGSINGEWSETFSFCVNSVNNAPSTPTLTLPANGAALTQNGRLCWTESEDPDCFDAVTYQVQLATDESFNPVVLSQEWENNCIFLYQFDDFENLTDNEIYFWRVYVTDTNGDESGFSNGRSFCLNSVNDPPTPVIAGFDPANGELVTDPTPTISWDPATDPDCAQDDSDLRYDLELSQSADFSQGLLTLSTALGVAHATVNTELADGTWFYHVRSRDLGNAASDWSATQSFYLDATPEPPPTPELISPANDAVISVTTNFVWSEVIDPDDNDTITYTLQILTLGNNLMGEVTGLILPIYNAGDLPFVDDFVGDISYRWRVRARDNMGNVSNFTASRIFTWASIPPPNPPLAISPGGGEAVPTTTPQLYAQNGTDPGGLNLTYEFQVAQDENFNQIVRHITGQPEGPIYTYWNVTPALTENETYFWRARCDNGSATSTWSNILDFCVDAINSNPTTPANLTPANSALVTPSSNLCWDASTDSDCGQTIIYRLWIDDQADFTSPAVAVSNLTATCATVGAYSGQLQDDQNYYWRVAARDNLGGQSAYSVTRSFCYNAVNTPPGVVSTGFDPAYDEEITTLTPTIYWNAADDPDCHETAANLRYKLEWGRCGVGFSNQTTTEIGQTSAMLTAALTENGHYCYRLQTIDGSGATSAYSTTHSFWVNVSNDPPTAPTGLSPADGADFRVQDMFSWNPATDPDPETARDIITYTVEVAETQAFTNVLYQSNGISQTSLAAQDFFATTALIDEAIYWWRVKASDNHGATVATLPVSITARLETPPEPPIIVCPANGVEIFPGDILCWTKPFDPDPDDVLHYTVQISLQANFSTSLMVDDIPDTFLVVDGASDYMQDDRLYYWRVKAIDSFDLESDFTASVRTFHYNAGNDAPNPVNAGFTPSNGEEISSLQPLICWTGTTDPDWSDPPNTISYRVELTTDQTFNTIDYVLPTGPGATCIQVTGALTENSHYFYRIIARDNENTPSNASPLQHFWINTTEDPPTIPTDLIPADCGLELTDTGQLCWSAATDPDPYGGIDYYELQIDDQPGFEVPEVTVAVSTTGIYLGNLAFYPDMEDNFVYHWRVLAVDTNGTPSAYANTGCFFLNKTNQPPHPVISGFAPTAEDPPQQSDMVEVCWDAAHDDDLSDPPETLHYMLHLQQETMIDIPTDPGQTCVTAEFAGDGSMDGVWNWWVVAYDDQGAASIASEIQSFTLNAVNDPPTSPSLDYPCWDTVTDTNQPTLIVSGAVDPDSENLTYEYRITNTPNFNTILAQDSSGTHWQVPLVLEDNNCQPYYWQARAKDDQGLYGDWSYVCLFVMNFVDEAPSPFALLDPQNLQVITTRQPVLDWSNATDPDCEGALSYELHGSVTPDYNPDSTFVIENLPTSTYTLELPLEDNRIYYWKVRAVDADGMTTWSGQTDWAFVVNLQNEAPSAPELLFAEGDTLSRDSTIVWTEANDPDPLDAVRYEFTVGSDPNMGSSVFTINNLTEPMINVSEFNAELDDGGYYYGRVNAYDLAGANTFSASVGFVYQRPVSVELAAFSGEFDQHAIRLNWEIGRNHGLTGFNVWRSSHDFDFAQINTELIVSGSSAFEYFDETIAPGQTYTYRLEDVDRWGQTTFHEPIVVTSPALAAKIILEQNYPNPFTPSTTINFALSRPGSVQLRIYNVTGQLVAELIDETLSAGYHHAEWNGLTKDQKPAGEGIYFYILKVNNDKLVKRMTLIR